MSSVLCLNNRYSTTRLILDEKPIIENYPDDKFETVLFLPEDKERKGEGGLRTKGYFKKAYKDIPLITIIIVIFNGEKYLEESILSVINQTYNNIELLIIDGGSSDKTLEIIKKHEDKIDYWVSESDEGIYDAMNKGLKCCSGKYIFHLGDDDYIRNPTVINEISLYINKNLNIDAFIGSIINSDLTTFAGSINKYLHFKNTIHHQGVFYNINVFKEYGLYNLNYKVLADFEFNKRVFLFNHVSNMTVPLIIAYCRIDGISKTAINLLRKERISLITSWIEYLKYKLYEWSKK